MRREPCNWQRGEAQGDAKGSAKGSAEVDAKEARRTRKVIVPSISKCTTHLPRFGKLFGKD